MTANGLVRAAVAAALMFVIPFITVGSGTEGRRGSVWILCVVIAVWSGWRLSGLLAAAEPRLYQFMFWLFCYIFMGIAPAAQLRTDLMPATTPGVLAGGDLAAGLVAAAGILAFELGVLTERVRPTRRVAPASVNDQAAAASSSSLRMLSRVVPLLAFTTAAALYFVRKAGLRAFFGSRELRTQLIDTAIPDPTFAAILATISWVPALVVIHRIVNAARLSDGRRSKLSGGQWLALALSAALITVVNNPLSSARYVFGAMALSLVVLFGGFRNRRRTRWTMLGLLVALFVLFPVADVFRRESGGSISISLADEYQGNADYDAFAQLHNAITIVDAHGYTFARQPLGVALFWVPRSVWPDKPIDTGIYIAEQRGYRFTNLSAPLWAEFYLAGGAVVVVAGFVLVGRWLTRADSRLVDAAERDVPFTVVGAFVPFYLLILLRGSLLQATALIAVFVMSARFTRPVRVASAQLRRTVSGRPHDHR